MTQTNLSELTPVEVDTLLLDHLRRRSLALREVDYASSSLVSYFGVYKSIPGQYFYVHPDRASEPAHPQNAITVKDVLAAIDAGDARTASLSRARYDAAVAALNAACADVKACDDEYQSRPWNRYWLVTSSSGHIHRSTHCSTCNKGKFPTQFALVPYLSGSTHEAAVADLGPALCTVCFPDAPVESREQCRISAHVATVLAEKGVDEFKAARLAAAAKSSKRASEACPGSGQPGLIVDGHRYRHACPCCGERSTRTSTGKVRPHRRVKFYVENQDYKAWDGTGWGPRTKALILDTLDAANAVVAFYPGATVRRK